MDMEYIKPNYFRIVLAGLIDAALVILFYFVIPHLIFPIVPFLLTLILYRVVTIINYGATFGMKLFGVTYLTAEQEELNTKEKLWAAFFVLYEGVDYFRKK